MAQFDYTWEFYVSRYYSFIYGLYLIEQDLRDDYPESVIQNTKNIFYKKVKEYVDSRNMLYDGYDIVDGKSYMQELVDADISHHFGRALYPNHYYYVEHESFFQDFQEMAKELVEEVKNGKPNSLEMSINNN